MAAQITELSALSDSELVSRLHAGDLRAYETLWLRHVATARRVARRLTDLDFEDLVSESFLTLFRQITVDGKGPQYSFRAYLFAVMRNIAARWHKEGRTLVVDAEVDRVFEDEDLQRLEQAQDDALLLQAFRDLPTRWQRVLWLAEIQNVGRPVIAAELGVRPNAVSALQRRARRGLRERWLWQHVPEGLREDSQHMASALPAFILRSRSVDAGAVRAHLASCTVCEDLLAELRTVYADRSSAVGSIGALAAVGVVLPGATTMLAAPTSISIAAGAGFTLAGSAAVVVGALTVGLGAGLLPVPFTPGSQPADAATAPVSSQQATASTPTAEPTTAPSTGSGVNAAPVLDIGTLKPEIPASDDAGTAPHSPSTTPTPTPPPSDGAAPAPPDAVEPAPAIAPSAPTVSAEAAVGADLGVTLGGTTVTVSAGVDVSLGVDLKALLPGNGSEQSTSGGVVRRVTGLLSSLVSLDLDVDASVKTSSGR